MYLPVVASYLKRGCPFHFPSLISLYTATQNEEDWPFIFATLYVKLQFSIVTLFP